VAVGEEGEASQSDQSVLGLTRLAEAEHEELAALTKAYRERFGFTLIMAVRDQQNIDQLLRSGWERLNNSPTQEHAAALIEIAKIATHRFDRLVADANPIQSAGAPGTSTHREEIHMNGHPPRRLRRRIQRTPGGGGDEAAVDLP